MTTTTQDSGRCANPNCLKFCWIGVLKEHEGRLFCPKCWPHRAHISKAAPAKRRGSPNG